MLRFALLRVLGAIPTLLTVIVAAFLLVHAAPGGPFASERVLTPEVERNLNEYYHLDEPLQQQLQTWHQLPHIQVPTVPKIPIVLITILIQ